MAKANRYAMQVTRSTITGQYWRSCHWSSLKVQYGTQSSRNYINISKPTMTVATLRPKPIDLTNTVRIARHLLLYYSYHLSFGTLDPEAWGFSIYTSLYTPTTTLFRRYHFHNALELCHPICPWWHLTGQSYTDYICPARQQHTDFIIRFICISSELCVLLPTHKSPFMGPSETAVHRRSWLLLFHFRVRVSDTYSRYRDTHMSKFVRILITVLV